MDELDGMAALIDEVLHQRWPHTTDAKVWADEWAKTLAEHPTIATDPGAMVGWFAKAIMAGYDTAMMTKAKPLTWTMEKPTKPGWYWWRMPYCTDQIVEIILGGGRNSKKLWVIRQGCGTTTALDQVDGEWQGPLEPQEVQP